MPRRCYGSTCQDPPGKHGEQQGQQQQQRQQEQQGEEGSRNCSTATHQTSGVENLDAPPPPTGFCVGKSQNKMRGKKNAWVWDQYARQMKAGSAASSSDALEAGGQQQGGEQMEASA
eukprot:901500-Pelagomonas_calceolata.AAC.1